MSSIVKFPCCYVAAVKVTVQWKVREDLMVEVLVPDMVASIVLPEQIPMDRLYVTMDGQVLQS